MSLDVSKLQNLRMRGGKSTARCPACAETGGDKKGEHLIINPQGHFGCVVYPGNGPDAKEHRRRIFALCGDRKIKPLMVRQAQETVVSGRSGRPFQSHLQDVPIKTGLLGRLGRAFSTHAQRHPEIEINGLSLPQRNDTTSGVLGVPKSQLRPNRPLTEQELLLLQRAGAENDPVIVTALNLFNATIVKYGRLKFMKTKNNNTETAAAAPEAPDQIKVKKWLAIRKEAGRKIDPETAEVYWIYGVTGDPYGLDPLPKDGNPCVGREYFARCPGSDIWVSFDDLPTATHAALWEKHKATLSFPAPHPSLGCRDNG
jgi:hypothetical protein